MTSRMPVVLLALLTSLSGCAKDYSLAPPADSEVVTVRVKVPDELEAETMQVMYRSTLCTFTDHTASGKPYQRYGYQGTETTLLPHIQGDIYEAKVPLDGGGGCKWQLSNVTIGVTYRYPERFGDNTNIGAGRGVIVVFDENNASQGDTPKNIKGDVLVKTDYYPWIDEDLMGGYRKRISLLARSNYAHLSFRAPEARLVYFEPILHSDFVVHSVGPKEKKKGNFATFTYPDGSIEKIARAKPDFDKLEAIRQAKESNAERKTKP